MAKATKDYRKKIVEKYGNVITKGSEVLEQKRDFKTLSVSPSIDFALGGGIKEGSWVILSGDPKSGKTTTALQIAANAQNEGRKVIYLDAEARLKQMNLEGVEGLDTDRMEVVSSESEPLSAEVFLDIIHKLIADKDNYGCVCIIDSTSSLIPEKELDGDMSPGRAGLPKLLSIFTKKMAQIIPNQRAILIIITHLIANTSGYGVAKMPDCGNKIQFQSDTRLQVKRTSPWEESDKQVGQAVDWRVMWSSMGSPGAECQSWIRYGKGIDKLQELIIMGIEFGLISKAGSWFTCDFMADEVDDAKKVKFQGQAKLHKYLDDNPEAVKKLKSQIII
jgi:recombination protein RecA